MINRSIDFLSDKEIKRLTSHYLDQQLFRIGFASGTAMLVVMSICIFI